MNVLFVFDLDDTLIDPDYHEDRKTRFTVITSGFKIRRKMYSFFKSVKEKFNCIILTSRPRECVPQIIEMFDVPVFTHIGEALTKEKLDELYESEMNKIQYRIQSITAKIEILKEYKRQYDKIFFFDDLVPLGMSILEVKKTNMPDNIYLCEPLKED